MEKIVLSFVVAVAASFVFAEGAQAKGRGCAAGHHKHGVNQRQRRQDRRIDGGVFSGELTRREFLRLEKEQYQIEREEARARRDGVLTPRERAELQRELNQASRHIYRAKHNNRDRN